MQNYTQLHSTTSFSSTTLVVEILIKPFAPVCIQWTHPAIERKTSISHAWDDTFTCPANLFFYCELSTCNLFSLSSENCICKSKYRVSRRGTCWAWSLGQKLHLGRIQSAYIKCVKIIKRVFVLETLLAFLSIHYAVPLIAESSSVSANLGNGSHLTRDETNGPTIREQAHTDDQLESLL